MKYINPISPTKVLGPQLDVKQQSNKTLSGLIDQLQTGSTIKATVSEVTQDGDVIFTTNHGKFAMPNELNLHKGDNLIVKLSIEGEQLLGVVTTINNVETKSTEPLQLSFTKFHHSNYSVGERQEAPTQLDINMSDINTTQQTLRTKITYINLSNINKNSLIYKALSNIDTGSPMEFRVIQDLSLQTLSPYQITGEVIGEDGPTKQLIKTPFGIILTEGIALPIGKKLILEIKSVNNANVDNMTTMSNIEDFLFNFNKNWLILHDVVDAFKGTKSKGHKSDIHSTKATHYTDPDLLLTYIQPEDNETSAHETILKFLNSAKNKEIFKELSNNFIKLKDLFVINSHPEDYINWQAFFIPIWDGEKIVNNKAFIKRKPSEFIRFVIEISLEVFGEIQIDGLIKLGTDKIPINFDLTVRFKGLLDRQTQSKISKIFLLNQDLSAVRGTLNFEQVENFLVNPELENS